MSLIPETDHGHLGQAAIEVYQHACRLNTPFMLLKPKIMIDGNKWCALYGDNLQDGVAGFGDSPQEAEEDFNLNWSKKL